MTGLFALLILAAAEAPERTEFQNVLGGQELDRGVFVSPTTDGGYIVTGATRNGTGGGEDILLMKLDPSGEPTWNVSHGGAEEDNGWSVHEIDGGYAVAGFTKSAGAGGFDFTLLATDSEGALRWSKTYGGAADDRCWALLPMADGGFVLAGETFSSGAGAEDFLLVKTDSRGEKDWSRTYGGEKGDRCFSVAAADDGGYLLVGQTYSEGAGDRDVYAIKTDSAGNEEWSRTFGGEASDVGHCVTGTDDGNFLITGYTTSFAASGDDPYLIKLNARGETLWTSVPSIEGISHTITGAQSADGGFYLVGFRNMPMEHSSAALLVRTDRDGRLEWSREILRTTRGQSFGYTVRATPDGGCVFTGHTTVGSTGDLDLLIVKVGSGAD